MALSQRERERLKVLRCTRPFPPGVTGEWTVVFGRTLGDLTRGLPGGQLTVNHFGLLLPGFCLQFFSHC